MSEFKTYSRVGSIEARFYVAGEDLSRVSVSFEDSKRSTWEGGFIARNPANHDDQWFIAPGYFAKHYGPASDGPVPCWCPYCGEPHSVAQRASK